MSFFVDIYFSFGISISLLASLFCNSLEDIFEALVMLSTILLPIKSPAASGVF